MIAGHKKSVKYLMKTLRHTPQLHLIGRASDEKGGAAGKHFHSSQQAFPYNKLYTCALLTHHSSPQLHNNHPSYSKADSKNDPIDNSLKLLHFSVKEIPSKIPTLELQPINQQQMQDKNKNPRSTRELDIGRFA